MRRSEEYNPDYHGQIVRNLRSLYKQKYSKESTLADSKIYQVFQEFYLAENSDESMLEEMLYEEENI